MTSRETEYCNELWELCGHFVDVFLLMYTTRFTRISFVLEARHSSNGQLGDGRKGPLQYSIFFLATQALANDIRTISSPPEVVVL